MAWYWIVLLCFLCFTAGWVLGLSWRPQNHSPHRPRRWGHNRSDGKGWHSHKCPAAAGGRDAAGWSGVAAKRAAAVGSAVGDSFLTEG